MTNAGSSAMGATFISTTDTKLTSEAERRDHNLPSCNGTLPSSSMISVVSDVFHTSEGGEDKNSFEMQRMPTLLQPMSMVPLHVTASMIPSPSLTKSGSELSSDVSLSLLGAERLKTCLQPLPNHDINLNNINTTSINNLSSRTALTPHSNPVRLPPVSISILSPGSTVSSKANDSTQTSSTPDNLSLTTGVLIDLVTLPNHLVTNGKIQPHRQPHQKEKEALTTEKVKERENSSYSAASVATISAQQSFQIKNEVETGNFISSKEQTVTNLSKEEQENANLLSQKSKEDLPSSTKRKSDMCSENKSLHKYKKVFGGKSMTSSNSLAVPTSPTIFLTSLIKSRGYSTQFYCSVEGGYYCKPTAFQKASYGIKLVEAVRNSDEKLLMNLLKCGISSNPCNSFGESILHMVCRRGDYKLLKILIENGCSLQVSDDFGRTPLHDACWTASPCFKSIAMILDKDVRLLHVVDCRGAQPLQYVKRDNWAIWVDFFENRKEQYWKRRDVETDGEEGPPTLCLRRPHSTPIEKKSATIDIETVTILANGKLSPQEFLDMGNTHNTSQEIGMIATNSRILQPVVKAL